MKDELLYIYYDIFDIIDDIEAIADAIIQYCYGTHKRDDIIEWLEMTKLHNLETELNFLYDMPMWKLREFKSVWDKKRLTLFDFEEEV
ncbi:MAG: hypothetical protein PHW89_07875 [Sulfurimonas denitrificans]|nr:hypothetical protein [Sulfurimonas denitrificans]